MSEVSNVLLAFGILEDTDARVAQVNTWLEEHDQFGFKSVWQNDDAVGGGKRMEAPLYAGAFNYFPFQEFLAFLRTIAWGEPDRVQVMVRAHGEPRWVIIDA